MRFGRVRGRRRRHRHGRGGRSRRGGSTFTWGADRMTFELEPDGDGTRSRSPTPSTTAPARPASPPGGRCASAGLRNVLADEPVPAPDRGVARHEELVHEFGLDGRRSPRPTDGWTVRYERQLTCPAEVAWDLWFGTDQTTGEQRRAPGVGEPLTPYMAPDVVIGTMTEVDPPRVMAFDVAPTGGPGDHVRVELRDGTGHGARLILTVTGHRPGRARGRRRPVGHRRRGPPRRRRRGVGRRPPPGVRALAGRAEALDADLRSTGTPRSTSRSLAASANPAEPHT